jgi:hypothetical protein
MESNLSIIQLKDYDLLTLVTKLRWKYKITCELVRANLTLSIELG